jgi:syntaxin 18
MADLTPLFKQCVEIVESEPRQAAKAPGAPASAAAHELFRINDTFVKECVDFRRLLAKLDAFIDNARTQYLEVHDGLDARSQALTVADKNKIDEDFQGELQQMFEKLKLLQRYEQDRRDKFVASRRGRGGAGWLSAVFGSDDDDLGLFQATAGTHRTQILRSLNELTTNVSKKWDSLQRQRHQRERQLNVLNFQDLGDGELLDAYLAPSVDPTGPAAEWLEPQLPPEEQQQQQQQQQQLQASLDAENQELVALKTNQFQQVEKLRNSMLDIVSLQAELSLQLETQSQQIDTLLENQGQVEIDVRMGNRSLTKATARNKTGSRIIITTSLVVAVLILFLDYIL